MRDSNGEGQSRDAIHHAYVSHAYENDYEVTAASQHASKHHGIQQQNHHQQQLEIRGRKPRRNNLLREEDEDNKPLEVAKIYACVHSGCTRTFTSNFKLSRHLLIHSGERRFQCTSCDRRFHRKDHLKNHLQVHNPNKILHRCDKCQKTYCSQLSYRKHVALHAAEAGDLVCRICGVPQPDREAILCHLKVHTGSRTLRGPSERKYPCKLCERSFFTKKDVKRHLVVHTGKRDFVCKYCPQRFGRKDHLVRHTKKSHNGNSGGSPSSNDSMRKYEPPTSQQQQQMTPIVSDTNHNHKVLSPSQISDMNGLMMGQSMMDPTPVLDPIKPDPTYHPNLVQHSSYAAQLSSLSGENGQGLGGRVFSESAILPVSQYLPMSPSYPGVMSHHYLNMSASSNILSDLLPPMSMAPSFTALSLDVGNPPLPHFNQAFQ